MSQPSESTSDSEVRQTLQDIWIGTSGVKIDSPEIEQTIHLIAQEANKAVVREFKNLVNQDRYTNRDSYAKKRIFDLTAQKESSDAL